MIPGVQFEEVRDALVEGYNKASLTQMLQFRLDRRLQDIVADGPLKNIAFDLLNVAEEEGWDAQLVREAYRFNPGNPALLRVYEKYGIAPKIVVELAGQAQPGVDARASSAGLQKLVRNDNPAVDIVQWHTRLTDLEVRVCRVDINGGPAGTGFLVGAELVLTNYHVVKSVLDGIQAPAALSCLFDFKVLTNGTSNAGIRVPLRSGQEILVHSPCTPDEFTLQPDQTLPTTEQLDFALLRLDRALGKGPIDGSQSPARGWETLPGAEPSLKQDQGIIIAQHPQGEPMKLAIDTQSIIGLNANQTRVRYRTNTEGGSSGSPVFDMLWNLVALHHLGDPAQGHAPQYNQGVAPLHLIRARIAAAGFGSLLG